MDLRIRASRPTAVFTSPSLPSQIDLLILSPHASTFDRFICAADSHPVIFITFLRSGFTYFSTKFCADL